MLPGIPCIEKFKRYVLLSRRHYGATRRTPTNTAGETPAACLAVHPETKNVISGVSPAKRYGRDVRHRDKP